MILSYSDKVILAQKAFHLLQVKKGYSQVTMIKKMDLRGFSSSTSTFNKIIKNKKVSLAALNIVFEGLKIVLHQELCYNLSEDLEWTLLEDSQPTVIPIQTTQKRDFFIHEEGRLNLADKVRFFSAAQSEIIEFGITLNSFSNYFESQRESVFKMPIQQLLEKGVDFKCYLLDPDWNGTSFYFEDRQKNIKEGLAGIDKIRASLRKLKNIYQEFSSKDLKGAFEVFTYRHIPQNYFLGIDIQDTQQAKMMTSNYLYGQKRADCPVMEFTRVGHPILFRRYMDSLQKLVKTAKKVDFNKISD